MAKILEEHPQTPIPVEPDVKVNGLKNPTYLVIIGFAGLQTLEGARKAKKEIKNVLIIEPSLSIFKQTIARHWVGNLVAEETMDLLIGIDPKEMVSHLVRIFTSVDRHGSRISRALSPEIIFDPFVYLDDKGQPTQIAKEIMDQVLWATKQLSLSMGCAADSHYRWEQLIKNERFLKSCYRLEPLFEKFKSTPAIVVGAGPSLEDFIDAYHRFNLSDRALIIACDASLRKLLDHNIRPHMVTRCERKLTPIFRGVTREDTKGIFYAAYPWCDPEYFDLFESSFLLYRSNGICKWTDYNFGYVDGGVSSANAALEIAYLFGCPEIYLTGVDLCFLGGKSHAEGTQVEFDPENSKSKWKKIKGNAEEVTTIPVWERCLGEYQNAVFKHPEQRVFNTSLTGAFIAGTTVLPWDNASERIAHKRDPEDLRAKMRQYLETHPAKYFETFQTKKKDTAKFLKEVSHDIEKLFSNVEDEMLIAMREEQKCIEQMKSYIQPHEYFSNVSQIKKSLAGAFVKPCNAVDRFKKKYYLDQRFSQILLDVCMIDMAQVEQRCAALANLVEFDHERLKMYVGLHIGLFRTLYFYIRKLIPLFEKGPDQTVEYPLDPITTAIMKFHHESLEKNLTCR